MIKQKININYNDTFATKHSRDYYRGASFHYSGKWLIGAHYVSDDYNVDFVVHDQVLLACAKSHLSTLENEPTEYITDECGVIIGVVSTYWDFVLSGINGRTPGVKIIDNYWYTCEDVDVPEEQQIWINTGVKAVLEYEDLTPEQIAELQQPGIDAATNVINERTVQTIGDSTTNIMSQKAVSDILEQLGIEINSKVQTGTTAYWNSKPSYIPKNGDVIVYTDYETKQIDATHFINVPGIKIGSGNAYLIDLAFVGEKEKDTLLDHITNTDIHVTLEEKSFWNNKLNVNDVEEVIGETLTINRN